MVTSPAMTQHASAFATVGITGKPGDPSVAETVSRLLPLLTRRKCRILLDAETTAANAGGAAKAVPRGELAAGADLVIAVGGDGTLINTARSLANRDDVALMGINRGRLGFLVDVAPERLEEDVQHVLRGDCIVEERMLLSAEVRRDSNDSVVSSSLAVNDVVVHRWDTARMVELTTHIDGELLNHHRSDGLVVATPTGSTAYAMAGGGPITHPRLKAMVLVPICPHTLSNRPLVVDATSRVEVRVSPEHTHHVRVSCDSQEDLGVVEESRLVIRSHPTPLRLVHPPGYGYFDILRAKLGWGGPSGGGSRSQKR